MAGAHAALLHEAHLLGLRDTPRTTIVAGLESGTVAEGAASDNISALALAWDEPAVTLAEGMPPGPLLALFAPPPASAAPDADILRAMEDEPESGVARLRQAVSAGRRP